MTPVVPCFLRFIGSRAQLLMLYFSSASSNILSARRDFSSMSSSKAPLTDLFFLPAPAGAPVPDNVELNRSRTLLKNMGIRPMKLAIPIMKSMGCMRAPRVERPPMNCLSSTACLRSLSLPLVSSEGLQYTSSIMAASITTTNVDTCQEVFIFSES
ncbi:hypothetical protein X975_26888, partial [Stegodyphus mimosarum]